MSLRLISNISSCSEDDENRSTVIIDEKKRKRMLSNRESARRSRMKKQQHIKDLNDQAAYFRLKNSEVADKGDGILRSYEAVESENRILRIQGEELKKRLGLLEDMLVSHQNHRYVSDETCDFVQELLIEPWLQPPPFQSQTVVERFDLLGFSSRTNDICKINCENSNT